MVEHPLPLRILLLGRFAVERGSDLLTGWAGQKAAALFKVLALSSRYEIHKARAEEILWPEFDHFSARNNLNRTIHFLRRTLMPQSGTVRDCPYLLVGRETLQLAPELVAYVDVTDFEMTARRVLNGDRSVAQDSDALSVYVGDLLPEDGDEWVLGRRTTLRQLFLDAGVTLAAAQKRRGQFGAAINLLRRVLAVDPACEEAHRELMESLALDGRRHAALRQYLACQEALARELDTLPSPDTERLYQRILNGELHKTGSAPAQTSLQRPALTAFSLPALNQSRPALVGRTAECARLAKTLLQAEAGHGQFLLLGGESGVGKTRLGLAGLQMTWERGWHALAGGCWEHEGQAELGPFVEALEAYLSCQSEDERTRLCAGVTDITARLLPGLVTAAHPDPAVVPGPPGPSELFAACATILDRITQEVPLCLFIDDLHAADLTSLQLIHFLARRMQQRRCLIVGTYKVESAASNSAFAAWLGAVRQECMCEDLGIQALSASDTADLVRALLGSEVDRRVQDEVFRVTAGNPFFVHEILRALQEQNALSQVGGLWQCHSSIYPLPPALHSIILQRVHRLGPDAVELLRVVAVLAGECDYRTLREVTGLPEARLLDLLDLSLRARVLQEIATGYRFHHDLVRQALLEHMSQSRLQYLHRKAGEALLTLHGEERQKPFGAIAHHFYQSDQPHLALPYLVAAGEKAAGVYAYETACGHFRQAIALAPVNEAAPLQERLGDLLAMLGRDRKAAEAYEAALEQADDDAVRRLSRRAALQWIRMQDFPRARQRLDQAQATSPRLPDLERARLQCALSHYHWHQNQFAAALDAAQQSLAIAAPLGADLEITQAYEMMALSCLPAGRWRQGLQYVRKCPRPVDSNQYLADVSDIHL